MFYARLWPDMVSCVRVDAKSELQTRGIDRMIVLPNGRTITVDEKKRDKDYGDLLVEEWSVFYGDGNPRNKTGWTLDRGKVCDFIAYAIPSACKCYLLPFELLRAAASHNLDRWKEMSGFAPRDAQNHGYVTRNWPVQWSELRRALAEQMLRRFGEIDLPLPTGSPNQVSFHW